MRGAARALGLTLLLLFGVALGAAAVAAIGLFTVAPAALSAPGPNEPWDLTLTMSDAYLTTLLNQGGANQPMQLTNAQAKFLDDGTIVITGQASRGTSGGPSLPARPSRPGAPSAPPASASGGIAAEIVLRPSVTDGTLKTEVVRAQFGPLTVPGQLANFLDAPLQEKLAGALAGKPYRLLDLTVRAGILTVHARRQ